MKKTIFLLLFFFIQTGFCFAGVSVVGSLTREIAVNPGDRFEGIVLLKNTGQDPESVRIYKTDYLFHADGKTYYDEPGSTPRSSAAWLSFSPNRLTVYPTETVSVHYTGRVPDDPNLKGTYWSLLMVEPMVMDPEEEQKKPKTLGIKTVIRYGLQMVTHIGNTGDRKIRFPEKKLVTEEGKTLLQVDMENIGMRGLNPAVWVELYKEDATLLGRFESGRLRIYPGCSVRHKMNLTQVPKGRYRALLIADNGDESVFGAQYDLELK